MTKLDQLQLQMRAQAKRIEALEARLAARAPKRMAAPRPSDSVIAGRERLWSKYVMLEMQHGHGRVLRLYQVWAIAARHGLNPSELGRWLSPTDRRGIAEGSKPDRSHRRELAAAIAQLEARAKNESGNTRIVSRGNVLPSQDSGLRLH